MGASIGCLTLALEWLPVGTAYTVSTGIGAVGTALVGLCEVNYGSLAWTSSSRASFSAKSL